MHRARFALLALMALAASPPALGQRVEATDHHDRCYEVVTRAHTEPDEILHRGELPGCGARGALVLAGLVARSHQVTDTAFLALVVENTLISDRNLFVAARDLAADKRGAPRARLSGFQIIVRQALGPGAFVSVSRGDDIANSAQPVRCNALVLQVSSSWNMGVPQDADVKEQIKQLTESIITDPSDAESVKSVATCVRRLFRPAFVTPINPALLHLSYKCDDLFRVHNDAPVSVLVQWSADGSTAHGNIRVPANGDEFIASPSGAKTNLIYRGVVIQSALNGGVLCNTR
jgi:hypothetical protein